MHKLLLPVDGNVDHKDGNGLNNRLSNLHEATKAQNARNSRLRKDSTSGVRGVTWIEANQKWRATISISGKTRYLGYFETMEEATQARLAAEQKVDSVFYTLRRNKNS